MAKKTALEQFVERMQEAVAKTKDMVMDSNFMDGQKGLATLAGYGRGGLKDLQGAIVHAFPDSQRQNEALGTIGSPTPQMVHESLTGKESPANGRNIDMDMGR
jgi:hypothetical protein